MQPKKIKLNENAKSLVIKLNKTKRKSSGKALVKNINLPRSVASVTITQSDKLKPTTRRKKATAKKATAKKATAKKLNILFGKDKERNLNEYEFWN